MEARDEFETWSQFVFGELAAPPIAIGLGP